MTSNTTTAPSPPPEERSVDTSIPETCSFPYTNLPIKFQSIPSSCTSVPACARWQLAQLAEAEEVTAEMEDALDDGFVLCDLNTVANKLKAWRHLFPRVKPFFALKCNPDPMVASVLGRSQACGFDCASLSEIQLALQSTDNSNSTIVYANPQRAEKDLEESLKLGIAAFTVDGEEELLKIYKKALNQNTQVKPQIILRLLVPDQHSTVPLGEKFGAPPHQVQALTQKALQLQLPVIGVSFHCGSGCHNPQAYVQAIRLAHQAMQVIDQTQAAANLPKCWLLDIGGGFPGADGWKGDIGRFSGSNSDSTPTINDDSMETAAKIAQAINPILDELFPPSSNNNNNPIQIISEPGRYFVEAAFALCSRIYRVSNDQNNNHPHYTIAQGVQGVFKDVVLCGEKFHPIPLQVMEPSDEGGALIPSTIQGPSGDVVCPSIELPQLQVGDWLLFDRMGAYTLSIAARSGRPPIRYVLGGGRRR